MNFAKLLLAQPIRMCSFGRLMRTESESVHNVLQKNENTMSNKNLILYNYIRESNSNKHFLLLPDVYNYWLKVPQDTLQVIQEALDYVLQGVLILDDVQDGTQFCRNLPSAHRVYGAPWAANASMFCFMAALEKITRLRSPEAVDVYCEQMMSALDGIIIISMDIIIIALEVYRRDTFLCPTEDEYIEMVKKKTSSFFLINFGLIQSFSEDRRNYHNLMNTYGVYYQIRDEYANLVKSLDTKARETEFKDLHQLMFCEDITEGRFTFPIIHGLNSREGPTIRSILVQRTSVSIIKQHCLTLLEKVGSLEYTRQTLHDLDADLREQKNLLPFNYIKKATSNKHLLTHLPIACNFWLKIPQDKLDAVNDVMDYVLHSIVLYDDVQDGTLYRRNLPAANRVYGAPLALNAAISCILEGFRKAMSFENPKALEVYCNNFIRCMNGTALDIYWRDNYLCPTEEEYKMMSADKTGSYFLQKFGLMQAFSQDQRNYDDLMTTLGLYYQIRDEYTNLVNVEALEEKSRRQEFKVVQNIRSLVYYGTVNLRKPVIVPIHKDLHKLMQCEDITEGRFTWTMIHALKTSEAPTIRSILVQRTSVSIIKQHCLTLLEKVGSLDYTRQTLHDLDADLREQVRQLGGNPAMIAFLDELYNWKNH